MSEGSQLNAPEWILALGTILGGGWAFLKSFFGLVTRKELQDTILMLQKRQDGLHEENKEGREKLTEAINQLTSQLANLDGRFTQSQHGHRGR